MHIETTRIPDLLLLTPRIFKDPRGFFFESFHENKYEAAFGFKPHFVQDNHSRSHRGVLRGLHYQLEPRGQGKLVRVVQGEIFDVAVDLRPQSPTYGQWEGVYLSEDNQRQFWIPVGFAHGFLTLSDRADVLYKTTDFYAPEMERCIRWDDPTLAIRWPITEPSPILSEKDAAGDLLVKL